MQTLNANKMSILDEAMAISAQADEFVPSVNEVLV
jgi:hypothetical protein